MASTYTRPQLEKLKVTELKDILRSNGQKMSGSKVELIDRVLTTAGTKIPRSPPRVSVGVTAASKKTPKKQPTKTPTKTAAISRQRIETNRVPLVPIIPLRSPGAGSSSPRSPNRVPIIPLRSPGAGSSSPRSPNRVPIIPVLPTSSPRVSSPGRVVITPSLSSPRNMSASSSTHSAGATIPADRSYNLDTSAKIKSIHYDLPALEVNWSNVPPAAILRDIDWTVDQPLAEAQIIPPETEEEAETGEVIFLPFTDIEKRQRNRTVIPSPTHSIYIEGIDVDDPNGPPADEFEDAFATLELSSPDEYPLTQWQVLRGLEKYYQWFMERNGGPESIGNHRFFEGLQHIGSRNGIPVYQLFLGS